VPATGDVIVRTDGHVVYPPEYIPRLVGALLEGGADNVGAVSSAPAPRTPSPVAQAIAIAMSHPFASAMRTSASREGSALRGHRSVPRCFRRELFRARRVLR